MKKHFFFFILLLFPLLAAAQTYKYIGVEDGLSNRRVFVQKVYYTIASSAVQGQKRRFSQLKFAGRRFFRFWRQIFGFLPAFSGSIFRWVLL